MAGPNSSADLEMARELGTLSAKIAEINHNVNNQAQKSDARDLKIAKLETMPDDVRDIKERLTKLETIQNQREGQASLLRLILKSPLLAWLLLFGAAAWAAFKGWLTPPQSP